MTVPLLDRRHRGTGRVQCGDNNEKHTGGRETQRVLSLLVLVLSNLHTNTVKGSVEFITDAMKNAET